MKNQVLVKVYNRKAVEVDAVVEELLSFVDRVRPMVADTSLLLNQALDRGETVLLEGGQATLLDVDHGTYPFVTSSSATAGGACTGSGIGPRRVDKVIAVVKAYTTRVGEGPFPTELLDADGEAPARERPRVRHDDRPPAPLRLVRRRHRPLRRARQRRHRLRPHQARRAHRLGAHPGLRGLRGRRPALRRDADVADRLPPRHARSTSTSTAGTRTSPAPAPSRTCRRPRRPTSRALEQMSGAPFASIGVGPGPRADAGAAEPLPWRGTRDLPGRRRRPSVPGPRAEHPRLGGDPADAGAARPPHHRQAHARPRRAARRGLDLLRRHVRPRRASGAASSTSRTACTGRCGARWRSARCCTPASTACAASPRCGARPRSSSSAPAPPGWRWPACSASRAARGRARRRAARASALAGAHLVLLADRSDRLGGRGQRPLAPRRRCTRPDGAARTYDLAPLDYTMVRSRDYERVAAARLARAGVERVEALVERITADGVRRRRRPARPLGVRHAADAARAPGTRGAAAALPRLDGAHGGGPLRPGRRRPHGLPAAAAARRGRLRLRPADLAARGAGRVHRVLPRRAERRGVRVGAASTGRAACSASGRSRCSPSSRARSR